MPGLSTQAAQGVLNHLLRNVAFTITSPPKLRLLSATATAAAAGTQISGGSYPAGGIVLTATTFAAPSGQSTSTGVDVSQTNMPAVTVNGVEITDSNATPVRIAYGPLSTPKTTNLGDTLTFASGQLSVAINSTDP